WPSLTFADITLSLNSGRAANTTPSAPRGSKRSTAESGRTHTVHSLIRADDAGVRSGRDHIDTRRETSQQRYAGSRGVSATELFKNPVTAAVRRAPRFSRRPLRSRRVSRNALSHTVRSTNAWARGS